MNRAQLLTSSHALEEILSTLRHHAILPQSLRLIGLLGVGNNATVFSVTIDDVHHVLKVYASRERMRQELKHLRKVTPPGRRIISWEDDIEGFHFNFFIVEMERGHPLKSRDLTPGRITALTEALVGLHRVRYQQLVSVAGLRRRLRATRAGLGQLEALGLAREPYERLIASLGQLLLDHSASFAIPKSRIHGDLWWPNVVATASEAYLIDWDEMRRADPAEDLAMLRTHVWFSQNAFPSRNFFWTGAGHGSRIRHMMQELVVAHDVQFHDDMALRLRFYLPLYGLEQLAKLAVGRSITEPVLRPSLYHLLAQDIMRLANNPFAPVSNLRGSEYYALVQRSRTERLDGLAFPLSEHG